MPTLEITVNVPLLPEGWSGTPDELWQFFQENATFEIDGEFPVGQIGGTRPTVDSGIWYGENSIERYINGKYRPISDVPIGVCLPFASVISVPENYLLCDGSSLVREDYPELFAVIGTTWGDTGDPTTFKLPDFRGRYPIGAGTGDYAPQGIVGKMLKLNTGDYVGFEWPVKNPIQPGQPVASMKNIQGWETASNKYVTTQSPAIAMPWIIRYR